MIASCDYAGFPRIHFETVVDEEAASLKPCLLYQKTNSIERNHKFKSRWLLLSFSLGISRFNC